MPTLKLNIAAGVIGGEVDLYTQRYTYTSIDTTAQTPKPC